MTDSRRGFTLIELVIVVMLISIATAVAAPRMAEMISGARVRKAVRDLSNMARLARNKAATEVKSYSLVLMPEKKMMKVMLTDSKENVSASINRRKLPTGITMRIAESGSSSGGGEVAFVFKPDGTCEKGEVVFRDTGGRSMRVRLDSLTGRAKVVTK